MGKFLKRIRAHKAEGNTSSPKILGRGFPARAGSHSLITRQEAEKELGNKMWHLFGVHALPR